MNYKDVLICAFNDFMKTGSIEDYMYFSELREVYKKDKIYLKENNTEEMEYGRT